MSVIITSGEPAGIGPDIIIKAFAARALDAVVVGNLALLKDRAKMLGNDITFVPYEPQHFLPIKGQCTVIDTPLATTVTPGKLDVLNAAFVLDVLDIGIKQVQAGHFSGLVTAPVHKEIINQAGISFTGHTEYLALKTQTKKVVMMLASKRMKVALVTTHLALKDVPKHITKHEVRQTIAIILNAFKQQYGISHPKVLVAGLNPHAGEGGFLGREEIDIINPVLDEFNREFIAGPLPADTMFSKTNIDSTDVFVAMYHDQGLSVLKYDAFGEAINVTLGLPFIRTSVDHGTALSLAGTGKANEHSLLMAINHALLLKEKHYVH